MSEFKLRAHHGLCINFFEGKGYNEAFVRNMEKVISKLRENPNLSIITEMDFICRACPNNHKGMCRCSQKVNSYDERVLALCGIKNREVMNWSDYSGLVRQKIIATGKLQTVCGDCQWFVICGMISK